MGNLVPPDVNILCMQKPPFNSRTWGEHEFIAEEADAASEDTTGSSVAKTSTSIRDLAVPLPRTPKALTEERTVAVQHFIEAGSSHEVQSSMAPAVSHCSSRLKRSNRSIPVHKKKVGTRGRQGTKVAVLTFSPYKRTLKESIAKLEEKKAKTATRSVVRGRGITSSRGKGDVQNSSRDQGATQR